MDRKLNRNIIKEFNVLSPNEKAEVINLLMKEGVNTNKISDGYHTFGELYEHRITLFIQFCRMVWKRNFNIIPTPLHQPKVWRSKKHSDGSEWQGWFIMGIGTEKDEQITYHLPISKWDVTSFAEDLERAPEWDGHTSNDVLERIKSL